MGKIGFAVTLGAVTWLGLAPVTASAHPAGAIDRYGCHEDNRDGTYHCHRGQYSGVTFRSKSAMLAQRDAGATAADAANSDPGVAAKQESLFGPLAGERSTDQRAAASTEVVTPQGIEDRLSVLDDLRKKNLITPEEYEQKRKDIVGQL